MALTVARPGPRGIGQNPAIPVEHAEQPAHRGDRACASRARRFVAVGTRASVPPLPPNVAMRYGLADARGYDYPTEQRYDELWRRAVTSPTRSASRSPGTQATTSAGGAAGAGAAGGVADVMQPPAERRSAALVYEGPDARVYANPAARPARLRGRRRARSPPTSWARSPQRASTRVATAVVSSRPARAPRRRRRARVVARRARAGGRRDDARTRVLLVLADACFPGWHATLDGRDAPIERIDYLLRGVCRAAGAHRSSSPTAVELADRLDRLAARGAGLAVAVWRRR